MPDRSVLAAHRAGHADTKLCVGLISIPLQNNTNFRIGPLWPMIDKRRLA